MTKRARELASEVWALHKCGSWETGFARFDVERATELLDEALAAAAREAEREALEVTRELAQILTLGQLEGVSQPTAEWVAKHFGLKSEGHSTVGYFPAPALDEVRTALAVACGQLRYLRERITDLIGVEDPNEVSKTLAAADAIFAKIK